MIQISPPIAETADPSAAEMIHQSKPGKKDGLGVFAKILAGLLRKTGEKDPPDVSGADNDTLKLSDSESGGPEALSALFPGGAGRAKGKKPGKTGGPENPDGIRPAEAKKQGPARNAAEGETDWNLASLNWLSPRRFETAGPADTETEEGDLAEPGLEFALSQNSLEAGFLAETGPEGENGEFRLKRREKTGEIKAPGLPAATEGFDRAAEGLQLPDMKKSGAPENGKEGNRPAESRSRDKRRDRINLEVRDFRTGNGDSAEPSPGLKAIHHKAGPEGPGGGRGETEIILELRGDHPGRDAPDAAGNTWESRSARSFEHILARELHENLNGDIVRHASMALRDHGQGTIRLSLKPESLGNVKIRLEMAENKITGHIVVESEEALRAFEREVHSLEQAFRDSGFDSAELDMSLAQGGGGAEQRWNGEETGRSLLSERLAASRYAQDYAEHRELFAPDDRNGMYTRNGRVNVNMLV